jgi:ABC-type nitrate/sulfonate/bicarbonate transport system substrate-binding protein
VLEAFIKQQGFLEQMGLDPTTINVGDGSKLMGGLLSGSADICVLSGISQVFPAIEHGGTFKIVAGACLLPDSVILTKKPEIKTLKDLEGKTVGTGSVGALLHQLVVALCQKKGVDWTKITFVNIGSSADVFRAVTAGTVDAGPGQFDVYSQQAKYGIHSLPDTEMWAQLPEYTYQGTFVTEDGIAKRRDVIVRVLAAYAKLYRFLQSPNSKEAFVKAREEALNTSNDEARKESEDTWDFFQKYKPYANDLTMTPDRIEFMQKLNVTLGTQKTVLPFEKVTDMSLAADALKMIG